MNETVEVDRDYLWALEVLSCDSIAIDGETSRNNADRFVDAMGVVEDANLTQPRARYPDDEPPRGVNYR